MRKIRVVEPDSELWKRWRKDCEDAALEVQEQVNRGERPSVSDIYRRKSIKESYFFCKGEPFYGKCAYCEVAITDYQHGDVEHFRPKLGVTNEIDEPVEHPGYYWLAYDWRNLLPSCIVCNQPKTVHGRKIGKHNRFPVAGEHARTAEQIAAEQPLLLHPLEDDPSLHLMVNTSTGLLAHNTVRGETCIQVFGLNLRDQLVEDRKRACREALWLLNELKQGSGEALDELKSIRAGQKSFSLAQNTVIEENRKHLQ